MIEKQILKKIKKYSVIIIARHVGADPDALASSISLKEIILANFPNKQVYVIGNTASRFKYLGILDKLPEDTSNALLIVTDTPDRKRIEGTDPKYFKEIIKIDHHPFIEEFGTIEWIDDTASSTSQMIVEFIQKNKLKISKETAEKLYLGIVADTERFLHQYTTTKTFDLTSWLIKQTNIDFTKLYPRLYMKNLNDLKFSSYITMNMIVTENKLGYIKLDEATLKEFHVDASTAGNLINNFSYIEEVLVLAFFSEDIPNGVIKCSIRSRGPIINETASHFNGGGHALASGAKLGNFEQADELIQELDEVCKDYLETNE